MKRREIKGNKSRSNHHKIDWLGSYNSPEMILNPRLRLLFVWGERNRNCSQKSELLAQFKATQYSGLIKKVCWIMYTAERPFTPQNSPLAALWGDLSKARFFSREKKKRKNPKRKKKSKTFNNSQFLPLNIVHFSPSLSYTILIIFRTSCRILVSTLSHQSFFSSHVYKHSTMIFFWTSPHVDILIPTMCILLSYARMSEFVLMRSSKLRINTQICSNLSPPFALRRTTLLLTILISCYVIISTLLSPWSHIDSNYSHLHHKIAI